MATERFNISFVIGAVDNLTMKVMEINDRVQKTFAPYQKLGSSIKLLGLELGLGKIKGALSNVNEKGVAVFENLKSSMLRLAAVTGTVAAGLRFLVVGASNTMDEIQDASNRIGVSTRLFQTLQYAATQSGVRLEKLEPILTKFSANLGMAAEGQNEVSKLFQALGVRTKDAQGQLLSMDEVLPSLADKLSKIQNPAVRNAIAIKLFGKEGVKFAQILGDGSKGLDAFRARAEELGIILGEDTLRQGAAFNDQMEELGLTFTRLRDSVGAELFPIAKEFLASLSKIMVENRPAIQAFAKSFAENLPQVLEALTSAFKTLWAVIQPIVWVMGVLVKTFGAAQVVFIALAGIIFGKLILSIYALGGALIKLGLIAATTPIGMIALVIGAVLIAITALIRYWGPITEFFKTMGNGWALFLRGLLFLMGPLGWLAAIALTIYRNWEPIKNLFASIGSGIAGAAQALGRFFGFTPGVTATGEAGAAGASPVNAVAASVGAGALGGVTNSTESRVVVDFNNIPQGTRIKTEKAETPVDLNMGYGMVMP